MRRPPKFCEIFTLFLTTVDTVDEDFAKFCDLLRIQIHMNLTTTNTISKNLSRGHLSFFQLSSRLSYSAAMKIFTRLLCCDWSKLNTVISLAYRSVEGSNFHHTSVGRLKPSFQSGKFKVSPEEQKNSSDRDRV